MRVYTLAGESARLQSSSWRKYTSYHVYTSTLHTPVCSVFKHRWIRKHIHELQKETSVVGGGRQGKVEERQGWVGAGGGWTWSLSTAATTSSSSFFLRAAAASSSNFFFRAASFSSSCFFMSAAASCSSLSLSAAASSSAFYTEFISGAVGFYGVSGIKFYSVLYLFKLKLLFFFNCNSINIYWLITKATLK